MKGSHWSPFCLNHMKILLEFADCRTVSEVVTITDFSIRQIPSRVLVPT